MDDLKVPYLNTDYQAKLGTMAIQNLQHVLMYLCKGIDKTELQKKLDDKQALSEQEQCALTLTSIIKSIYTEAETEGKITYKSLDQAISSSSLAFSL